MLRLLRHRKVFGVVSGTLRHTGAALFIRVQSFFDSPMDIRTVQHETNRVAETLRRTEMVTDEHVYAAAKTNKQSKNHAESTAYVETYRLLTQIRGRFDDMVTGMFFLPQLD